MDITNTVITRSGEAKTANARYQIEYSVAGGVLTRISASITHPAQAGNSNETYLGNIYWDNGNINCSFQMTAKAGKFLEDFEGFIEEIKEDVKQLNIK
jgi:hypothetical protein